MISPLSSTGVPSIGVADTLSRPTAASEPFSALMEKFLSGAVESHGSAEAAVQDLATGRTDNLHGVMLQVAQADLSFRMILEIRNRLTDAYQEVMKMQI